MEDRSASRPRLVLVAGVPGAGKTTLARALGDALHLPVVLRDQLKSGLADTRRTPAWADQGARDRLGWDAFALCHQLIGVHLDAGCGAVAEAAWHWSFAARELAPLWARAKTAVIHVAVDPDLAADRYRERHRTAGRHASHHDDRFASSLGDPGYPWERYLPPADLPVPVFTVDGALAPADVLADALRALRSLPPDGR